MNGKENDLVTKHDVLCEEIYSPENLILPNENIIDNYTQKLGKNNNKNTNTLLNYFKIEENNNSCEENGYRIKYIYV